MDEDRYTRITLRIPKELHSALTDAADTTSKSLNAEIVGRLQASFESPQAQVVRIELTASGEVKLKDVTAALEQLKPYIQPDQTVEFTLKQG